MAAAPSLSSRIICGALAGLVATAPMTAVMYRVHRKLGRKERYPLPPREIVGSVVPQLAGQPATNVTLVAHFAYGALSGAALSAIIRKPTIGNGVAGGLSIWFLSYLGWIPGFSILKPATDHPVRRNVLMNFAHGVWGAAFAVTQRDLLMSAPAFADGPLKDAAGARLTRSEPPRAKSPARSDPK